MTPQSQASSCALTPLPQDPRSKMACRSQPGSAVLTASWGRGATHQLLSPLSPHPAPQAVGLSLVATGQTNKC